MVAVPPASDTPHTTPVDEPTVAISVLLLLHVPPPGSVSTVDVPAQAVGVPAIGFGKAFTVTTVVVKHPPGAVYVIITVVLNNTAPPVTLPVVSPTEPRLGLLDDQVPPVVASLKCVTSPAQTRMTPVMGSGTGFTVTVVLVKHRPPNE